MIRQRFLYILFTLLLTNLSHATVQEDAEDGNTAGWSIYDNNPAGATITNVVEGSGRAIELQGSSRQNGYMLGSIYTEAEKWHDTDNDSISWRIKSDDHFVVYLSVETTNGHRYITYTSKTDYHEINGEYITLSVGGDPTHNRWVFISRNIQEDIHEFEPNNELLSIDAFLVRGSVMIDDIETRSSLLSNTSSHIYDIGGNTNDWQIYDNNPAGATVTSEEAGYYAYTGMPLGTTHHTKLDGDGRRNGFMLGGLWGADKWNNTTDSIVTWRMNFEDHFVVYISIETTNGHRYITYTSKEGFSQQSGEYIILSLGGEPINNGWVDFSRDIEATLHQFEPNNNLVSIDAFLVRGSGLIDNVITYRKDHNSLLLAESDRYNHTEQYPRDYAKIESLEATELIYISSQNTPYGAIGFYTFVGDGLLSKKNNFYNVGERWNPMYNVEDIGAHYNTSAYIWTLENNNGSVAPTPNGTPSNGSLFLERYKTGQFTHDVIWRWSDISDLDNIFFVEQQEWESY